MPEAHIIGFTLSQMQDKILRDGVMLSATQTLTFPPKPSVSQEAKDFLSQCVFSSHLVLPGLLL